MARSTTKESVAPTKRAGLYARVSTKSDEQAGALAASLERLRAYSLARGFAVAEYSDRLSGAKNDRPGYVALLEAARRREVDVIVVTKLDRLSRSVEELIRVGRSLAEIGVDLIALDQPVDTTTSAGRLFFNLLAVFAEFERDMIRDRVRRGIESARAKGSRFGRLPTHPELHGTVRHLRAGGLSLNATVNRIWVDKRVRVSRSWVVRACAGMPSVLGVSVSQATLTSAECGPIRPDSEPPTGGPA